MRRHSWPAFAVQLAGTTLPLGVVIRAVPPVFPDEYLLPERPGVGELGVLLHEIKVGQRPLRQLRDTINSWGQDAVNIQFDEHPGDEPSSRLIDYLNNRLGQSGSSAAP